MSLKIAALHKNGEHNEEYILLEATEDLKLNNYAVIDRTYDKAGKISNLHRHFYRFQSGNLKKGEFVALITGHKKDSGDFT